MRNGLNLLGCKGEFLTGWCNDDEGAVGIDFEGERFGIN